MNKNTPSNKPKRAPGIKDVAKRANVSIATVSNVLNGTKAVSESLRLRVLDAVDALDYKANPLGKNLKRGRTNSVAAIIPSITSVFFPPLLKELYKQAEENDFTFSLFSSSGELRKEQQCIEEAVSHGVDGIFLSSCANPDDPDDAEYINSLNDLKIGDHPIHVICLESSLNPNLNAVEANDREGTIAATEHLISIGRHHIAYIAAPQNYHMGVSRKKGYLDALEKHDILSDQQYITVGDYTPISGYHCMNELLDSSISIDGLVCGNDQMAIGAMRAIMERGLMIPDDIAVIGYNDNAPSSLVSPSLSTMHVPKEEMAAEAFRLFLRALENDNASPLHVRLATDLIIRNSTDPTVKTSWDLTGW